MGAQTDRGLKAQGVWSVQEQGEHINFLDLKACQLGLLSLCKRMSDKHIQLLTDNTTACSYLAKFGGRKPELNKLAREIWEWCITRNIHLSVAHIPGVSNKEADCLSRSYNDDTEWSLDMNTFHKVESMFGKVDMDLFASRLNTKKEKYVARFPEAEACAVNAFTISWRGFI